MRVRLVRGTRDAGGTPGPVGVWCAGKVPVGTVGTVRARPPSELKLGYNGMHVEWDGFKAAAGFVYGLGALEGQPLPSDYEEVISGRRGPDGGPA